MKRTTQQNQKQGKAMLSDKRHWRVETRINNTWVSCDVLSDDADSAVKFAVRYWKRKFHLSSVSQIRNIFITKSDHKFIPTQDDLKLIEQLADALREHSTLPQAIDALGLNYQAVHSRVSRLGYRFERETRLVPIPQV